MIYNILYRLIGLIFLLIFRWRIDGVENIPAAGGFILAANHRSYWDPPLIGCALPLRRKIHFMAKEELFAVPGFGWIISQLGAFPVRRGAADRNAIRTAINLAAAGEVLGIFPEGTRSKTGELGQAAPGMAMIALKAGVPILPAGIVGTDQVFCGWRVPRFQIRFGEPVALPENRTGREAAEDINSRVMTAIADLLAREGR